MSTDHIPDVRKKVPAVAASVDRPVVLQPTSAPMREQIVPLTMGELEKLVRARLMVDRMVQQIEGPQADDGVH